MDENLPRVKKKVTKQMLKKHMPKKIINSSFSKKELEKFKHKLEKHNKKHKPINNPLMEPTIIEGELELIASAPKPPFTMRIFGSREESPKKRWWEFWKR